MAKDMRAKVRMIGHIKTIKNSTTTLLLLDEMSPFSQQCCSSAANFAKCQQVQLSFNLVSGSAVLQFVCMNASDADSWL